MSPCKLWIYCLAGSFFFAAGAQAAEPSPNLERLVQNHVRAARAGDTADYMKLVHPAVQKAFALLKQDEREILFENIMDKDIPEAYEWQSEVLDPAAPLMFEEMVTYSVRPTQQIQLDYELDPVTGKTVYLYAVEDKKGWYLVFGVPTAETLEKMKEARRLRIEQLREAGDLFASLDPSLLSEVQALLKEGGKIDAVKAVRARLGVPLSLASDVVEKIIQESVKPG